MSKQMLIDATHAEETRVVVLSGKSGQALHVEEFDFESLSRKQLRGNIYLAKVTRVEPSLQAAFVEYGGNRQGFLAFNEIHPDYYQIPIADREKLMAELAKEAASHTNGHGDADGDLSDEDDGDDLPDEERRLRQHLIRRYKIQEVIKRRQILLIQVVKEERGNKGAALTTYLSLAGRYCVLMPNTARGGGISRKITNAPDRKRLKTVVAGLDVPQGMGLIIRTAGAKRTKQEIKRDYDYLLRVWENVRETTLTSNAPALIYEEEDLVKRAIRDLFDKDVEAIHVEGEDGYRSARDFMRMIMPSQAKKIQLYRGNQPLFARFGIEEPLSRIYSPTVPLKSGGYLVINQTEALVAIDVNSGKSTRERNIESTALKTNLEAAEEAARQMRLRDLAGLIVIDFIDMDESKNNRAVEKKLKDSLVHDRARLQMGKISGFGLMEISRQRRRTGVLEGTTIICKHCEGMGRVRSVESAALAVLRAVDLEAMQNGAGAITVAMPQAIALYILNEKQAHLLKLKIEWGLRVSIEIDTALSPTEFNIHRTVHAHEVEFVPPVRPEPAIIDVDYDDEIDDEDDADDDEIIDDDVSHGDDEDEASRESREPKGRHRRRNRGGGGRDRDTEIEVSGDDDDGESDETAEGSNDDDDNEARRRRRRRGRRGGRRGGFEIRQREPYGWVRARTPSLDAPYVWIDPFEVPVEFNNRESRDQNRQDQPRHSRRDAPRPQAEHSRIDQPSPLGESPQITPRSLTEPLESTQSVPSSLVSEDTSGSSRRRQRPPRRPKTDMAQAGSEVTVLDEPVEAQVSIPPETNDIEASIEAAIEKTKPVKRTRRKTSEVPVTEPEIEIGTDDTIVLMAMPVASVTPAPTPVVPADDPNEIKAPAEKPKRGWWRR